MKRILIDEEIGARLTAEFACCRATVRTALYFRDKEEVSRRREHLYERHLAALERYRAIRERALKLGGIEVELLLKSENDDDN
jgi:hypothetical protein